VLVADHVRAYPLGPARAPFERNLQAGAHHHHRPLDAPQSRQPVPLESFGIDSVVDRHIVPAPEELPHEGAAGGHARVVLIGLQRAGRLGVR
jgi:hypothetical protein